MFFSGKVLTFLWILDIIRLCNRLHHIWKGVLTVVTIKDVAKEAGVSVATVSRVLNGTDRVRSETVDAVQKAIEKLNYHPNFLGRTLRRLETMKILVVLPTISNQFYSRVVRGIQTVAMQNGYHVMLVTTENDTEAETEYIEMVRRRLLDGIIFLFSSLTGEQIGRLSEECPVVVASETIPGLSGVSSVTIDNRRAGYDAAGFLLRNGCKRIAYISAGRLYGSSFERGAGVKDAVADAGLPAENVLFLDEGLTYKAGRRAAERLFQSSLPDAVFAASDAAAIGLMHACFEKRIQPGKDISVMGFDNNPIAEYFNPALTTVAQPQKEIGLQAMQLLLRKIHDPASPPVEIRLPHRLIIRESVRLLDKETV